VTAVAVGAAVITATSGGRSGRASVTVVAVDHVVVTPSVASVASGSRQPFTVTSYDANDKVLPTRAVSWASSNTSVATVDASGVATGVAAGLATIAATVDEKTGSATLEVITTDASCSLVDGTSARSTSPLAKPGYLQPTREPDFGTTITRVTGDPGTPIPVVGGTWGTVTRQNYSKDPAWSADGKLIVLKYTSNAFGSAYLFLDGDTYQPLFARTPPGVEKRWHPTLPDVMVIVTSTGGVIYWNARTNVSTTKFSVSGYSNGNMGPYEGNVSYDGKYAVVNATRNSDGEAVAYVVDIDAGTKYPDIDLAAQGISNLDWISISALGGYVVSLSTVNGSPAAVKVFTKTGSVVQTWTDFRVGHLDLGVDQAGNEVMFTAPGSGTYAKRYIIRRLADGVITPLTPPVTYNHHVSTRNYLRRGWAYAVTNDITGGPLDQTVYASKLDTSGVVERLARHRSTVIDYDSSPFAVPSPDGRRVLFDSNWGAASGRPVQTYVADTRQVCPNGLPP